jgi:signal peptidase I
VLLRHLPPACSPARRSPKAPGVTGVPSFGPVEPVIHLVAVALAVAAAALLVLRRLLVVVDVVGPSMQPTYVDGDRVLVRRSNNPSRGDVAVLRPNRPGSRPGWMIKRVVALAGDPMSADVARAAGMAPGDPVPDGHVVLHGDNAAVSSDSRVWGPAATERVLGVVVRRLSLVLFAGH